MQFSNKFSASPLGGLHQRLTDAYQAKCKKDKKFEDCELRANTNESKSLRVKTGDLSGWSTKTRNAHRVKAFPIVGREFLRSVDSLIAERKGLSSAVVAEIKKSAAINWSNYAASKQFLTVGDLPGLYTRAVRVVEEATPLTADEFETPNSEESMHPAPAGTGLPSSASLSSS